MCVCKCRYRCQSIARRAHDSAAARRCRIARASLLPAAAMSSAVLVQSPLRVRCCCCCCCALSFAAPPRRAVYYGSTTTAPGDDTHCRWGDDTLGPLNIIVCRFQFRRHREISSPTHRFTLTDQTHTSPIIIYMNIKKKKIPNRYARKETGGEGGRDCLYSACEKRL